ncbi:MAG: hypothetical protein ACPF8V_05065 [Luteibaculum sp.]
MRFIFALLLFLLFSCPSYSQFLVDGFRQPKQSAIIGLSTGVNSWDSFYSAKGEVGLQKKTWITNTYLSLNPIQSLRIAANIPYLSVIDKDVNSFQDLFVHAQWMPIQLAGFSPFLLFGYGEPLNTYQTEIGNAIGQQATLRAYGFGIQYTLGNWFGALAYQHQDKNQPVPDANQWQIRGGYFKGKWFAALRMDHQTSVGGSNYRDGSNRPFTTLGADFTNLSVDLYRRVFKNLGFSATIGKNLGGNNVGNSMEYFFGIILNGQIKQRP